MFAVSLRYRTLAAERGAEPAKAANIERLEGRLVELEAAILDLPSDPPRASSTGESFTCSMHPEIHQRESGTCPICGMDLIGRQSGPHRGRPFSPSDPKGRYGGTIPVCANECDRKWRMDGCVVHRRISNTTYCRILRD